MARGTRRKVGDFEEQWERTKKECPLVAVRYLEALEALVEHRIAMQIAWNNIVPRLGICDPQDPLYVGPRMCEFLNRSGGVPEFEPKPRCRPHTKASEIGEYIECMVKRLTD